MTETGTRPTAAIDETLPKMPFDFMKDAPQRDPKNAGGKPAKLRRLTKKEFYDLLAAVDLSPEEFATIWGTNPRRVLDWLTDEQDGATGGIPFPIAWALALLQKPDNFNLMQQIVGSRAEYKPEYIQRGQIAAQIERLKIAVEARMPDAERVASNWERENSGTHPYRTVFAEYNRILDSKGVMNIKRQLEELKAIAGQLGLGIDVNEQILEENAPFVAEVDRARRARFAKQRAAAPELPAYRGGKKKT